VDHGPRLGAHVAALLEREVEDGIGVAMGDLVAAAVE
jgi:hypothetical protein